jgi:SAM-dependent methyltransferase
MTRTRGSTTPSGAWRAWSVVFEKLPALGGQTVLDLGCGSGEVAAELVARGARVIGIDLSAEQVSVARERELPNAEFHAANLRTLRELRLPPADGLWSSFSAAYFTDLRATLAAWREALRPGGWIAVTEIDDLFGHGPLGERARKLLAAYARDALAAGRYDFHSGRKLRAALERAGFTVTAEMTLPDGELAFEGAAAPEVLASWRARLERMQLLRAFCGDEYDVVRDELLACLANAEHRSLARVRCCVAAREG